jgi:hypothetical protein
MVLNATLKNISVITWTDRQSHNNRAQTNTRLSTKKVGYNIITLLHFTLLHFTLLYYYTLHYYTLHYYTLHYYTLHFTLLHFTLLHFTLLHFTLLHYYTLQIPIWKFLIDRMMYSTQGKHNNYTTNTVLIMTPEWGLWCLMQH